MCRKTDTGKLDHEGVCLNPPSHAFKKLENANDGFSKSPLSSRCFPLEIQLPLQFIFDYHRLQRCVLTLREYIINNGASSSPPSIEMYTVIPVSRTVLNAVGPFR